MNSPWQLDFDTQANDYQAATFCFYEILRSVPSAQDDSQLSGGGREKKTASPSSFPLCLPCSGLSS
jgi:hypothetical protein